MNPGDLASTLVVFLEDRHGKALVRLPNGSKTSLPHECLDLDTSLTVSVQRIDIDSQTSFATRP